MSGAILRENEEELGLDVRLGTRSYQRRLELEAGPRNIHRCTGNWREALLWRFQPYALLGAGLKASFLWSRGYRNYLNLRVVEVPVTLSRLPAAFHGFKILQLTDLHIDLAPELVPVIRKRLSGIAYDLAVITGDFKNLTESPSSEAIRLTKELLPSFRPPLYATLGNHDTLDVVPPLEAAGLQFLLNESITLEREGARITLAGVDDSYFFQTDDIPRALAGVPDDQCKLLLSHAPSNYHAAAAEGVDYFISGHTHGGQICLRKGVPAVLSGRVPAELIAGHWKHHQMHGYTSRGTGACHLPIRFNCPGEITVHVLKSPAAEAS